MSIAGTSRREPPIRRPLLESPPASVFRQHRFPHMYGPAWGASRSSTQVLTRLGQRRSSCNATSLGHQLSRVLRNQPRLGNPRIGRKSAMIPPTCSPMNKARSLRNCLGGRADEVVRREGVSALCRPAEGKLRRAIPATVRCGTIRPKPREHPLRLIVSPIGTLGSRTEVTGIVVRPITTMTSMIPAAASKRRRTVRGGGRGSKPSDQSLNCTSSSRDEEPNPPSDTA
jgi:hypothetical protein